MNTWRPSVSWKIFKTPLESHWVFHTWFIDFLLRQTKPMRKRWKFLTSRKVHCSWIQIRRCQLSQIINTTIKNDKTAKKCRMFSSKRKGKASNSSLENRFIFAGRITIHAHLNSKRIQLHAVGRESRWRDVIRVVSAPKRKGTFWVQCAMDKRQFVCLTKFGWHNVNSGFFWHLWDRLQCFLSTFISFRFFLFFCFRSRFNIC